MIRWASALMYNGLGRYEEALVAAHQDGENLMSCCSPPWRWRRWSRPPFGAGSLSLLPTPCGGSRPTLEPVERTGARRRGALAGAPQRWRDRREALSRGDRAAGPDSRPGGACPRSPLVRRMAAPRAPPLDAREQLRHAHKLFTEFGMEAFAERARVELEATGEHARKRTVETRDDLTPQETQISASRPTVPRTMRSPGSCTSAPAPSTTTYARRSASSE